MIKNRTVLALSFADALSTLGDAVGLIALVWLVMVQSRNSVDMGILIFLYGIPGLVSGPFVGILMDRWSRKWTVIIANGAQSAIFLLIAALSATRPLPVTLYVLVLLAGFLIPPTAIGSFMIIAEHVKEEQLLKANALNELFTKVPVVIGPAIGGWLITMGGIRVALLLDAASFFLAAVATFYVPNDRDFTPKPHRAKNPISYLPNILSSLIFIFKSRVLWLITLVALIMNGASGLLEVSLPLLVHRQLHLSASLLGTVWMVYAIGTIVGAFANTVIHMPSTYGRLLAGMIVGWGIAIVWAGLLATPLGLFTGFALAGVSFGAYPPIARTIVQTSVPPEKRGQIFSVRSSIIGLGVPVGALFAGVANAWVTPSIMVAMVGAVASMVGLLVWMFLRRAPVSLTHEARG